VSTPEVVYESALATIYCAKAEDVLPVMASKSVDLIVTDPPYGVNFNSNFRKKRFGAMSNDCTEDRQLIHSIIKECVRIVRPNRHLYVFGPSDVLDGLSKVSAAAELIWDKNQPGAGDLRLPWAPEWEPITFLVSKSQSPNQSGTEVLPVRMRKGNVLRFSRRNSGQVRHPTEKPVGLLLELIESSSLRGEIVLDPFAGVGSTGVAAILAGRRCVLIETEERWADIAVSRIKRAEGIASMASGDV
jgi:site-specific DNA-methyltransferase (adenine-specific)